MMDKMETHRPPAPTPATARPNIKNLTDGATAQNKLPSSKIAIEVMKTGFAADIARTFPKNKTKAAFEYI